MAAQDDPEQRRPGPGRGEDEHRRGQQPLAVGRGQLPAPVREGTGQLIPGDSHQHRVEQLWWRYPPGPVRQRAGELIPDGALEYRVDPLLAVHLCHHAGRAPSWRHIRSEAPRIVTLVTVTTIDPHRTTPAGKPRARSLGIPFGGRPGRWNAITDVSGVEVGYTTLIEGSSVRTGVTAIHPRGPEKTGDPVAAGFHSQNGNGEMTGVSWINESGTFDGPVAITNTHAVGVAHAGIIAWTVVHHPVVAEVWLLPVAAETWDGYLNDINGHHVTEQHVVTAIDAARPGPVEEGSVGGGTGMNCYQFKGGSGTASRLVDDYTVGVFVQANFGARRELVIAGVPLGNALADDNPMQDFRLTVPGSGSVIA